MEGTTSELNEVEAPEVNQEAVEPESNQEEVQGSQNQKSFKEALMENMAKDVTEKPDISKKESINKESLTVDKEENVPVVAPADMNAEEKAIFEKADPKLKQYLSRRAHENRAALSREFQKIKDIGQNVERYVKAVEPYKDYLAKHKVDPVLAIENSIAWDKAVKENPIEAGKQWLEANGIDVYALIDDDGTPQPRQSQNGQQSLTQEQINELVNQGVEQALSQREAYQNQIKATENATNVFKSFAEDKVLLKDPGTAARVKAAMAPTLAHYDQYGMPPGVDEAKAFEMAYQIALERDPDLKNALNAYNQASEADKARARANQARQASSSISGGLAGANPSLKNVSFREGVKMKMNGVI